MPLKGVISARISASIAQNATGRLSGDPVAFTKRRDIDHGLRRQFRKYRLDDIRNGQKRQSASQEGFHGDLVGGIQHGRGVTASA